jgi:hypothetical protein
VENKNVNILALIGHIRGTVSVSNALMTDIENTAGLVVGMSLTKVFGDGEFNGVPTIVSIDSEHQITMSALAAVSGEVLCICVGNDSESADGAGLVIKADTDKTMLWSAVNGCFEINQSINLPTGKTFQINHSPIGGTGGAVDSVKGEVGDVILTQDDIADGESYVQFSSSEQMKLLNIEENANNYTHPANHSPSIITQDANNRFVTDTEKSAWLILGESDTNAYRGDRGKIAYDHSQLAHAPSDAQKNSDITKSEIEAKLTTIKAGSVLRIRKIA